MRGRWGGVCRNPHLISDGMPDARPPCLCRLRAPRAAGPGARKLSPPCPPWALRAAWGQPPRLPAPRGGGRGGRGWPEGRGPPSAGSPQVRAASGISAPCHPSLSCHPGTLLWTCVPSGWGPWGSGSPAWLLSAHPLPLGLSGATSPPPGAPLFWPALREREPVPPSLLWGLLPAARGPRVGSPGVLERGCPTAPASHPSSGEQEAAQPPRPIGSGLSLPR